MVPTPATTTANRVLGIGVPTVTDVICEVQREPPAVWIDPGVPGHGPSAGLVDDARLGEHGALIGVADHAVLDERDQRHQDERE